MSVFKRPGSPFYQVEFIHRGHRARRSCGTASLRDAEAFERALRVEVAKATPAPRRVGFSLDQACGKYWIEHGKKARKAKEVLRILNGIKAHLDPDSLFTELCTADVVAMAQSMHKAGIGPMSVNHAINYLRAIHNRAAVVWELPVRVINWKGHKTKENKRTRSLSHSEAQAVLAALPGHIRAVALFLLMTGLRRTEGFSLVWERVRLADKTMTVRTKGGKLRVLPLGPEALAVLHSLPNSSTGHIFDTTNWRKHWDAALVAAGVEDLTWHDLRHTFATWLGQSGASLEVIRDLLGHTSISMTERYRHVASRELHESLQKLPALSPHTPDKSLKNKG